MYYYGIVLVIILGFNLIVMPFIENRQVHQVDYATFTEMVAEDQVEQVQINETENQIIFTTGEQVYRVGMVEDVMLTERLLQADVEFSGEIREQMSPLLSFLMTWILPIGIFMALGNFMQKRL